MLTEYRLGLGAEHADFILKLVVLFFRMLLFLLKLLQSA